MTLHGAEARHTAHIALLNGGAPSPEAFPTFTLAGVLEIATPPFFSDEMGATLVISAGETTVGVELADFDFIPADAKITAGTTVTRTKVGGQPHTATAEVGNFSTCVQATDWSPSHTFDAPSIYRFVCTLQAVDVPTRKRVPPVGDLTSLAASAR